MDSEKKTKKCPICDSEIPADSKVCPECGTDLTLFDVSMDVDIPIFGEGGEEKIDLDNVLKELSSDKTKDLLKEIENLDLGIEIPLPKEKEATEEKAKEGVGEKTVAEEAAEEKAPTPETPPPAAEKTPLPAPPVSPAPHPGEPGEKPGGETLSETPIPEKAEEKTPEKPEGEGTVEMFECPICHTLVDASATQCPNCGALFVEEAEAGEEIVEVEAGEAGGEKPAAEPAETGVAETAPETPAAPPETTPPTKPVAPETPSPGAVGVGAEKKPPEPAPPAKQPTPPSVPPIPPEKGLSFIERMRMLRGEAAPPPPGEEKKTPLPPIPQAPPTPQVQKESPTSEIKPEKTMAPAPPPKPITKTPKPPKPESKPAPKPAPEPPAPAQKLPTKPTAAELTRLVGEMKPLLFEARRMGVDVTKMKNLISQAIAAGKKKDFQGALLLVKESKDLTERAIYQKISNEIASAREGVELLKKKRVAVEQIEQDIKKAEALLENKDYTNSYNILRQVLKKIDALKKVPRPPPSPKAPAPPGKAPAPPAAKAPPIVRADIEVEKENIRILQEAIKNARTMGFDTRDLHVKLEKARNLLEAGNLAEVKKIEGEVKNYLDVEIPSEIQNYLVNIKPVLTEAVIMGKDLGGLLGLIKEAKVALKRGDVPLALEYLVEFKKKSGT